MESKSETVYTQMIDCNLQEEIYKQEPEHYQVTLWLMTVFHFIVNFVHVSQITDYMQQLRKPIRKNVMGLRRACRRTFRKIFGISRKSS